MPKIQKTKGYALINELKEYYINDPISVRMLDDKEDELRALIDAKGVKQLEEIRRIVKEAKNIVEAIKTILVDQKELSERERAALIGEKEAHEFYIDRLGEEDVTVKQKLIEDYLQRKVDEIRK